MSSSKPRLLIVVKQVGDWSGSTRALGSICCFSSPQPRNHYGNSSLVIDADFHTKFFEDSSPEYLSYASGLFYFSNMRISKKCEDAKRVIYNPSTGQYVNSKDYEAEGPAICNPITGKYVILPPPDLLRITYRDRVGLLGFDPIGKQFKVLEGKYDGEKFRWVCQILTLETENMRWREIKCPHPDSCGICIDGVLYYKSSGRICCFDVRSEKFMIAGWSPYFSICDFHSLINYKGKLCGSNLKYGYDGGFPLTLSMWVLEDVEIDEWSTYAYTLNDENTVVKVFRDLSVVGVNNSDEIVLAKKKATKPFYVFYFNPETNTLRSVKIQGVEEEGKGFRDHKVHCFLDHVEDLSFDVMKTTFAAISIRSPEQSTSTSSRHELQVRSVAHLEQDRSAFVSVNKFDALCLSEDDSN